MRRSVKKRAKRGKVWKIVENCGKRESVESEKRGPRAAGGARLRFRRRPLVSLFSHVSARFHTSSHFSHVFTLFALLHTFRTVRAFSRFFTLFALIKPCRNSANLSTATRVSGPPEFLLNSRNTGVSGSRCSRKLRTARSVKKYEKV